jgi:hypothetical protein
MQGSLREFVAGQFAAATVDSPSALRRPAPKDCLIET